jgi:predicted lipoprotein with Yx(FWY)xxD motif
MAYSSSLTPTPTAGRAIPYTWFTQLLENINLLNGGGASANPVPYTPTWASIGGTPVTVGNAAIVGQSKKIGTLVFFDVDFTFGSTSNQGAANTWTFTLPSTANGTGYGAFSVFILDAGLQTFAATGVLVNTTTFQIVRGDALGDGAMGAGNSPIATWATGDQIKVSGWYTEA